MALNDLFSIPTTHAELAWEPDDAWKNAFRAKTNARATAQVGKATEDYSRRSDHLFFNHSARDQYLETIRKIHIDAEASYEAGVEQERQTRRSWVPPMEQQDLFKPFNVGQDLIDFTGPIYINEGGLDTDNSSVVIGTQVGSNISAHLRPAQQIPNAAPVLLPGPAMEDLVILEGQSSQHERSLDRSGNQRELEFRRNEEDRQRIFLESQERRDREARERADAIWQELRSWFPALPAHPSNRRDGEELITRPGVGVPVGSPANEAASQHAADITEPARAERDRLTARAGAERIVMAEDRDIRIRALEDELAQVRAELGSERQQRLTEAEMRERERQEFMERDEPIRNQLVDITNLVQEQRETYAITRELTDSRWEEKQSRRQDKDARWNELIEMVHRIPGDRETDRLKTEEKKASAESKPNLEVVIEELQRQSAEQRELFAALHEGWRADYSRKHEETMAIVKETANEQVPFNVQGYLDDFTKALSLEVRMLLHEVGNLTLRGYSLQRKPSAHAGSSDGPSSKSAMPPEPSTARPGWIEVPQSTSRKQKQRAAPIPPLDPRQERAAWTTWRSDPGEGTTSSSKQASWATWLPDPTQ